MTSSIYSTRLKASDNKICVIVPVYNNASAVGDVIREIKEYCDAVIAVDDGSSDGTSQILQGFAGEITILTHPRNRGKGAALTTGFRHAREMGYRTAVTIDADGQHSPLDLPAIIDECIAHPHDMIVGVRNLANVDIKASSSFANKFSNFWFTVHTFKRLRDTQTGFRAYPLDRMPRRLPFTSRYESELSYLTFMAWRGVGLRPVDINVYYPPREERVSHFRPVRDFTRISVLNSVQTLLALVYGWPRIIGRNFFRIIFQREFRSMTFLHGKRREAALTLGRLARSTFGGLFFGFYTTLVFTPLAVVYIGIGKPSEKRRLRFHKMLKHGAKYVLLRLPGSKVRYLNPSGENFSKPSVVICNHQSYIDLMCLLAVSEKFIFITNDRVWHNFLYGQIIRKAEFMPTTTGYESLLPRLEDLVKRGYSIVIFPEGTRNPEGKIGRFHQGAFYLARHLNLDIVSFTIHGAAHFMSKSDIIFRRNPITLKCLGRTDAPDACEASDLKTASLFRRQISENYGELARESENMAYFASLIKYKYAWRGKSIVSETKKIVKALKAIEKSGDSPLRFSSRETLVILNAGIGVEAIALSLVNPGTFFIAYESDICKNSILRSTSRPSNLSLTDDPYEIPSEGHRFIVIERCDSDDGTYQSLNPEYLNIRRFL